MAYFLDLFSPETYEAFSKSDRTITGFRRSRLNAASKINKGDKFICYLTKLSRWVGILEVIEGPFIDKNPRLFYKDDPFVVRFRVKPIVWLDLKYGIPIHEDYIWNSLSFTCLHNKNSSTWTGKLRSSLSQISENDGKFLESAILSQVSDGIEYPIDWNEYKKLFTHRIIREEGEVEVIVPEEHETIESTLETTKEETRESIKIQALLAEIGSQMGMKIWIPKADRSLVLKECNLETLPILERLPLNYDDITLKTIEQIDLLWLKGRAIKRVFEIEHSTSIYSGILRIADLLALQPNMDIKLHIVAPSERRERVFKELRRPVFSLLEKGPLAESCTFLSYKSVREIAQLPHLSHLSESIIDEYIEEATDV